MSMNMLQLHLIDLHSLFNIDVNYFFNILCIEVANDRASNHPLNSILSTQNTNMILFEVATYYTRCYKKMTYNCS